MKIIVPILITFLLAGCAHLPVGWGGRDEVVHANEKVIMIIYDPLIGSMKDMALKAEKHCNNYGKHAIPNPTEVYKVGIWMVNFKCE